MSATTQSELATGQRVDLVLTLTRIVPFRNREGDFGRIYKFRDRDNRPYAWFTNVGGLNAWHVGKTLEVRATINGSSTYRGETETKLARLQIRGAGEQQPAPKAAIAEVQPIHEQTRDITFQPMTPRHEDTFLPPAKIGILQRLMELGQLLRPRDVDLQAAGFHALLKPTQGMLSAGIDSNMSEVVDLCLDAGLKPSRDDLELAMRSRVTAARGRERTYSFRDEAVKSLKPIIAATPGLENSFASEVMRLDRASRRGIRITGIRGIEGLQELFPSVASDLSRIVVPSQSVDHDEDVTVTAEQSESHSTRYAAGV